ncbi:MAG: transposase, partial [Thermoplasmata archaeon]|nr:transposase [Thermoplasmata archaeon]
LATPTRPVGVDLGVAPLATLSNGERIEPLPSDRRGEQRLRRAQRRLARKLPGSHRYILQRIRVARAFAKGRRRRKWFNHQLSHDLVERFDLIAFEDLDAARLIKSSPLSKKLWHSAWGILRDMTEYKASLESRRCVRVATSGTTQECCRCGKLANPPLLLIDRVFRCDCGFKGDRDVNAARNILARGMNLLSEELRRSAAEVTRVESGPTQALLDRPVYRRRRACLVKREHGIVVGAPFERTTCVVELGIPAT